jgi:hypothetical protein
MFAIPGILALIFFIYLRPQEVVRELQSIPLLYAFFALALFGLAVDIKRGINRFSPGPHTIWVAGYLLWSVATMALLAPDALIAGTIALLIPMLLYLLVAQGVRSFRSLEVVAGLLFAIAIALGVIGTHQSQADYGCAVVDMASLEAAAGGSGVSGRPDGRPCEVELDCYRGDPEPGADYMCERIGLLDTISVAGGRVRYRGLLGDPNELGVVIAMGMMLGFGFYRRRPTAARFLVIALAFALVLVTSYYTQSRSAQLSLVAGLAVWAVFRWRWKAVIAGGVLAMPLLVLIVAGSGRADADESTETRLEAWSAAIQMFRSSPAFGVGAGQFTQHHVRTAHNSFLLPAAELGLPGAFLWIMCLYVSFKIPLVALRRYRARPDAQVAVTWSVALLASLAVLVVGSIFLSWSNHQMLWIHLGLAGGLYAAIRAHDPSFEIRIGGKEIGAAIVGCLGLVVVLQLYLRLKGF